MIASFIDDSSWVESQTWLYIDNQEGHRQETKTVRSQVQKMGSKPISQPKNNNKVSHNWVILSKMFP